MIKFTEEQKEKLKKTNDIYLLGRLSLSTDPKDYPPITERKKPVSRMKNSDSVAYFVEMISVAPDEFDDDFNEYFSSDFFIGIDFCTNPKFLPKDHKKLSVYEREKKLYKHLSNKLIIFKPKINFKGEFAYKNLEIVALIDDDKINKKSIFTYCPICLDDNALSRGKEIYLPNSPHSEKFQSIIFSDKNIYLGKWKPVKNKENYWIAELNKKKPIVKFSFDEILAHIFVTDKDDLPKFLVHKNIFVNIDNHTCFFFAPLISKIDEYIKFKGGTAKNIAMFSINKESLFNISKYCLVSLDKNTDLNYRSNTDTNINKENNTIINIDNKENIENIENIENKKVTTKTINKERVKEEKTLIKKVSEKNKEDKNKLELKSEQVLLNQLNNVIYNNNLLFENEDILKVYTSLKTNKLTILSGMTGIGKTKLIKSFADTFGLNSNDNTLLVMKPNSSYEEPSDVLGFYNAMSNKYVPSECALLDILISAYKNKDKIHMIILEDMDSSKIETWFEPILSLLENTNEEKILTLYNKNIDCLNADLYPSQITLGDNVLFVGTLNTDKNITDFSNKLLDKSNIINISKKNFISLKELVENKKININNSFISYNTFNKFRADKNNYLEDFSDIELVLFDQLHELLYNNNENMGISHKVLVNISDYISNIPKNSVGKPMINRDILLDSEIKQRILTKIKGSEKEYGKLLGTCNSISGEIQDSLLYDFFNSNVYSEISNFNETKKEIIRKSKELDLYGYTE